MSCWDDLTRVGDGGATSATPHRPASPRISISRPVCYCQQATKDEDTGIVHMVVRNATSAVGALMEGVEVWDAGEARRAVGVVRSPPVGWG